MSRRGAYRRLFSAAGRRATIEQGTTTNPTGRVEDVRVRIRGLTNEEIAGGVNSNERRVLILAEDVPDSMLPLQKNNRLLIDGLVLRFDRRPDDQTHRDGDTLLAIDGYVTGA